MSYGGVARTPLWASGCGAQKGRRTAVIHDRRM